MLTKKEIEFINNYREEDTNKLLLSNKDKELNISLCIKCIEARKKIEKKIPLWYSYPELCYPISLSIEQSSSQQTAQYKQKVIKDIFPNNPINIADITGGMGIDSYFLSKIANNLTYIERNTELCKAAQYNFSILGANNISIINTETLPSNNSLFDELSKRDISLIYADPARRDNKNSKIVSIKDYEPNILELLSNLFSIANYILIKISPMEDIKLNLSLLPNTTNIYVISYNNECKEVLFLLNKIQTNVEPLISAINIKNDSSVDEFNFYISQEENSTCCYASNIGMYVYEPNKSILKSGAYKILANKYNLEKIAPSTHIYTSNNLISNFPGKTFIVKQILEFNKKNLKEVAKLYPCASIVARNFPINTNELKKLSGIKDGGDKHILVTTLNNKTKKIIIMSKD